MKIKYFRLSKEERKKYNESFLKTNKGNNAKISSLKVGLCGILLSIIGLYIIIDAIINIHPLLEKIWGLIVFSFGIFFIVTSIILYIKKLNDFIVKHLSK